MAEAQQQLLIRFRGICGHVDLPNGNDNEQGYKKKKRTLLLRHSGNGSSGIEHHIPYVEFFADDVHKFPAALKLEEYSRPGVEGRLARIDLPDDDAMVISLQGIPGGLVSEEGNYQRDIPHISEVLPQGGSPEVRDELKGDPMKVSPELAAGVFDMPDGRLLAGEPEASITRFKKGVNFKPRRLARWADLIVEYKPPLTLELKSVATGAVREVVFRDSLRMLTIGNEPERLILGLLNSGTNGTHHHNGNGNGNHQHNGNGNGHSDAAPLQPTGHYILYYGILKQEPNPKPVPIPTQVTGPGCPNNNYP